MSRCSFITLSLLLIAYYYWSYQFFLAQPEPSNAVLPPQVAIDRQPDSVENVVRKDIQRGQGGDAVKEEAQLPADQWEADEKKQDADDDDRAALKDEDDDLEGDEKKPPAKKKKPKKKKNKKKKQKHHEDEKPVKAEEENASDNKGDKQEHHEEKEPVPRDEEKAIDDEDEKPKAKEKQQPSDQAAKESDKEPPKLESKEKPEIKDNKAVAGAPVADVEEQKHQEEDKPLREEEEKAGDGNGDRQEVEEDQHPNGQVPNNADKEPSKPEAEEKPEAKDDKGDEPENSRNQHPNNQTSNNGENEPPKPEAKEKLDVKEGKDVAIAPVADVKKPKDAVPNSFRHMAVVSVTYFEKSQSYPPNTMVVVFTAAKKQTLSLQCWSANGTHVTKPASVRQITKRDYVPNCRWNTHIATCQTATKPTEFGLISSNGSDVAKMPYREAAKQHYGVVGCFSPMFYSDRWQVLIALIDIYRQLGMDLQVFYVMSVLKQIADYMKVYESLGHIRMEPWYPYAVKNDAPGLAYDPNLETEWRNQPGAHTDCLIHYRDSAEFILFGDIDEIMFTKLGKTFMEEFSYLTRKNPSARSFQYDRYNSIYTTTFDPKTFTITQLLNSTTVLNEWSTPKAVVRPSRVDSMWIHFPGWPSKKYKQVTVKPSDNFWVHFRKWEGVDTTSGRRPKWLPQLKKPQSEEPFKYQVGNLLSADHTREIEKNFRDFVDKHAKLQYGMLTRKAYYYAEFEKCYREIFYDRDTMADFCPTSLRCNISSVAGLQCTVAATKYEWKQLESDLVVHYPLETGGYEIRENGC